MNRVLRNDIQQNRPPLTIWKKARPPLRIEKWGLRLHQYNFVLRYIPGNKNPIDYMSRNPITTAGTRRHQKMTEDYVNVIAPSSIPRAMKIENVKRATDADDMMQSIIILCRNRCWSEIHKSGDPMMREFYNDESDPISCAGAEKMETGNVRVLMTIQGHGSHVYKV